MGTVSTAAATRISQVAAYASCSLGHAWCERENLASTSQQLQGTARSPGSRPSQVRTVDSRPMLSLRAACRLCPSPQRLPCRPLRVCDRVRLTQSTCAPMSSPGAAVCDRWRGGSGGVSRQLDPAHLYRVLGQQVRCCLPSASVLQRRWAPSYCVGRSTVRRPRVSNHLRVRVMMTPASVWSCQEL